MTKFASTQQLKLRGITLAACADKFAVDSHLSLFLLRLGAVIGTAM